MTATRSTRWRGTVVAVTAVLGLVLGSGAVAAPQGGTPETSTGATAEVQAPVPLLQWGPCAAAPAPFECTTAEVPTDYDDPTGPTTTIALTRLPASDPANRIGSLFTNPGGPGGSGVDFLHQAGPFAWTPEVLARFDVIGFDPRAVGASDPATCFRTQAEEDAAYAAFPPFPVTDDEESRYIGANARLGTTCRLTSEVRFEHSSTANVARDMDLLRQAVGDERLSYVGYSYGTFLGATYARLFPDRVRALVLDGTVDPAVWIGTDGDQRSIGARLGQGPAAHQTYGEFLRLCAEAGPQACPLAALGDPGTVVEELFDRLRTEPVRIEVPGQPPLLVTYQLAVALTFQYLYSPVIWTELAAVLAELALTDTPSAPVARLLASAAQTHGVPVPATRPHRGEDYPSVGGALASLCADVENPLEPSDYPAQADAEDAAAPHFGRFRSWVGIECEFLRVDDDDAYTGPWEQDVDEPVLVIGTRFDPATAYAMTEPYAAYFPDARVLTLEGWGHTILGQSSCADEAVARYLVDRTAQDGASCRPDYLPFTPLPAPVEQQQRLLHDALPVGSS